MEFDAEEYLEQGNRAEAEFLKIVEPVLTIGQVRQQLQKWGLDRQVHMPRNLPDDYDFLHNAIDGVGSWRGAYDWPCFYHEGEKGTRNTVSTWIKSLDALVNPTTTYHGWKGGEYKYTEDSPLVLTRDARSANGVGLQGFYETAEGRLQVVVRTEPYTYPKNPTPIVTYGLG